MGFFKYDLAELIGSGARVVYADGSYVIPVTAGAPTISMDDIIDLTEATQYAPKTPFLDFGAAREGQGSNYERNVETQDWSIEQATGAVATDITNVPRTMTIQMAQIGPTGVQILENAPGPRTIAAAPGKSAQTAVDFGEFEDLTRYRVVLLGARRKGMGADVTEPDGTVRGAFAAVMLFSCSISANASQYELQKGQLANVPIQLESFPETTITDSKRDRGTWIFENEGAIAP